MKQFAKVYVEITNRCNRSCSFCPGTSRAPQDLSVDAFRIILDRLSPYTDYLYFHLMGEPLLHPALEQMLALADDAGFRVILTTNGTLLTQRLPLLLQAHALHKLNCSLHSFEANKGGEFTQYIADCCHVADTLARRGILVNLRLWNLDGAHSHGQNSKNEEALQIVNGTFPRPWNPARGGYRLADNVYLNYGERFLWPDQQAPDYGERRFCYGLKDQIGVLCDGTVVPCCLDRDGDLALGNLLLDPLAEILNRQRARTIRDGFARGIAAEELCRRCEYSTRFRAASNRGRTAGSSDGE